MSPHADMARGPHQYVEPWKKVSPEYRGPCTCRKCELESLSSEEEPKEDIPDLTLRGP